jgi:hypothetical protein
MAVLTLCATLLTKQSGACLNPCTRVSCIACSIDLVYYIATAYATTQWLQEFSLFKKACDDKLKAEQEVSHASVLLAL